MANESENTTKKTTSRATGGAGRTTKSSAEKSITTKSATTKTSSSATRSTKTTPASAKEKLEKSLKGLSFAGSGAGGKIYTGAGLNNATEDKSRKKVGGVVLDMDTIQDANKQKLSGKGNRRNTVLIIVLSVLLIISLAYLAIAVTTYFKNKKDPNLVYLISTDVDARWIIEGGTKTKFNLREGLGSGMIYEIDSKLQINTLEKVYIEIVVAVRVNGEYISEYGLMGADENLVNMSDTLIYEYAGGLEGGGTITVCTGIDFKDAPANLTSDNVKIEIIATIISEANMPQLPPGFDPNDPSTWN